MRNVCKKMTSTDLLIQLIREHPIFYDHDNPGFRDSVQKEIVWESIADQLGMNIKLIKRKWRNLKDTYSRYLRSIEAHSTKHNRYKSWQWADKMEFCRPYIKLARKQSNINGFECDLSDVKFRDMPLDLDDTQSGSSNNVENRPIKTEINITEEDEELREIRSTTLKRKRKLKAFKLSNIAQQNSLLLRKQHPDSASLDPIDLIFLGYAKIIKSFSSRRQAIVKMRLAQIMMEEEMNELEELDAASTMSNRSDHNIPGSNANPYWVSNDASQLSSSHIECDVGELGDRDSNRNEQV